MASIRLKSKIKNEKIKGVTEAASRALYKTGEALHTEVKQAQVMPFDTGNMQNESTFVTQLDATHVTLTTSTPYAERLYFHPEYNFNQSDNPNAKGRWLEDWISGSEKEWVQDTFSKIMIKEMRKMK